MNRCPFADKCPFFGDKMKDLPLSAELFQDKYCDADFTKCARYEVRTKCGKEAVPANLYPNQRDRAEKLMDDCCPGKK